MSVRLRAMPTPAERKALVFLAGIALLGAGVRLARSARETRPPNASADRALDRQVAAVDSARSARSSGAKPKAKSRKSATPVVSSTQRRQTPSLLDLQRSSENRHPSSLKPQASSLSLTIDLDVATAAEIEPLPLIGPVLAARIVTDRDSLGPFGSLENFERVRGVGPAMVERLRSRVTFSGSARPNTAAIRPRKRGSTSPRASPSGRTGR